VVNLKATKAIGLDDATVAACPLSGVKRTLRDCDLLLGSQPRRSTAPPSIATRSAWIAAFTIHDRTDSADLVNLGAA
jgi:hypothetical protein